MFGIILPKRADHLAQSGIGQAFGVVRVGGQAGETCGQAERADFVGTACGEMERDQAAERPAEDVGGRVDFFGEGFGNCGDVERFGKGRVAVSGQIERADVPIGTQARDEVVEDVAVRCPAVYQINFFGGVRHGCFLYGCVFLVVQCGMVAQKPLRIMPRLGFSVRNPAVWRFLRRLRGGLGRIFYGRGKQLPLVFPHYTGRGGVRRLSEEAAGI